MNESASRATSRARFTITLARGVDDGEHFLGEGNHSLIEVLNGLHLSKIDANAHSGERISGDDQLRKGVAQVEGHEESIFWITDEA